MNSPVDNLIKNITDFTYPTLKCMNIGTNILLTISSILYTIGLYYAAKGEVNTACIILIIGYIFDNINTFYTKENDYYNNTKFDCLNSVLLLLGVLYVMYERYDIIDEPVVMTILGIFFVLLLLNYSCQTNKLNDIKPERCESNGLLGLFGKGTFFVVLLFILQYLDYNMKNYELMTMMNLR
jgi:hypothetical protein